MQVDSEVLSVLSRATTNGTALTLVGQLDRKLYERTNKVPEAAGGKWDRRARRMFSLMTQRHGWSRSC